MSKPEVASASPTMLPVRRQSRFVTGIIAVVAVAAGILFAVLAGSVESVFGAVPVFVALALPYSVVAWLFDLPGLKWSVLGDLIVLLRNFLD